MISYNAKHSQWKKEDVLIFQDNKFHRKNCSTESGTFIIIDNQLELHWNNWPIEILLTTNNHDTYVCIDKCKDFTLTRIKTKIEIQLPQPRKLLEIPTFVQQKYIPPTDNKNFVKERIKLYETRIQSMKNSI